jgi:hypothetical protein
MHFGMIRKRRKHLHFTRTIHLRPFFKCACSTVPHNLQAMCPDRISNSGGYTAVRSVMHLGMIPKWRKHKKNIRSNKLRPVIKCACSSGPQNVHAMCPDRNPNSGDDTAARWVMRLGMIPKWGNTNITYEAVSSGVWSSVLGPQHHKIYKQCALTEFVIRVMTQPPGEWCTLVWSANGENTYILHEPLTWGLLSSVLASVTGYVTNRNYVQQYYDVIYVSLVVSTSGKISKGGVYEVVHSEKPNDSMHLRMECSCMTACGTILQHSLIPPLKDLIPSKVLVWAPFLKLISNAQTPINKSQVCCMLCFHPIARCHPSIAPLFWLQWLHTQDHSRYTYTLAQIPPLGTHGTQLRPWLQTSTSSQGANSA